MDIKNARKLNTDIIRIAKTPHERDIARMRINILRNVNKRIKTKKEDTMLRYTFTGKRPNRSQHDEIEKYLLDNEFVKVLKLTKEYYIQGYHGDYGFLYVDDSKGSKITVNIY